MVKMSKTAMVALLTGALVACGGSEPAPKPLGELTVSGDLSPSIDQSVALIATVANDKSDSATILWSQTSGPKVEMIAAQSAVLAFDLTEPGSYSFNVDYTATNGSNRTKAVSFTAASQDRQLKVRRDHAVREGNKVSFKLSAPTDAITGDVVSGEYGAMSWSQTAGPAVIFDANNTDLMTQLFTAPMVSEDTLLSFTVSAQHPNGQEYQDRVYLLVQDTTRVDDALFDKTVAKVVPYNKNSRYAQGLIDCVYNNNFTFSNRCTTDKLPLIGQQTMSPTIDDIMERVVVSHPWMGDNFKKFLEEQDSFDDFRLLLRSVNAIVLAYDIRPSFYWSATGAIYLDPENLWLTPQQRDVIDVAPDYRRDFGGTLQYLMPWRYVKNNEYADSFYPADLRVSRTTFDLLTDLGSLLYHELAHANDIFGANTISGITARTLADEAHQRNLAQSTVSRRLTDSFPKDSDEMTALAQVNFHGVTATAEQAAYLPAEISNFFSNDVAAIEYGYSSIEEDTATLFDATMMSARYGIDRDVAVTDAPLDPTSETIVVDWGQRGRVNAPGIAERAKFVVDNLMPELASSDIMASLPDVKALPPGFSWTGVLDPDNPAASDKRSLSPGLGVTADKRPLALDLKSSHH